MKQPAFLIVNNTGDIFECVDEWELKSTLEFDKAEYTVYKFSHVYKPRTKPSKPDGEFLNETAGAYEFKDLQEAKAFCNFQME